MKKTVFLNDSAQYSEFGLFETMRSYKGKIVYFDQHLKRIQESCRLLGIDFPSSLAELKMDIHKAIKLSGFCDARVKIVLLKNQPASGLSIYVKKYTPCPAKKYSRGFNVSIADFKQNESNLLARIKTTSRLSYELAYQKAKENKYDEAIILNNRGHLAELTRSNIFFVQKAKLFTPALECGCLNGITRQLVLDLAKKHKLDFEEGKFWLSDLEKAQEAFLTNSLLGVMPLTCVENRPIGSANPGGLTKFFIEKYSVLLKFLL